MLLFHPCISLLEYKCCFLMLAEVFIARAFQILIRLMETLFSSLMFELHTQVLKNAHLHILV